MGFPISVQDGKIRGEVGIGPSITGIPGPSIYGEIDPNDIGASRVGIGGQGSDTSIGRDGIRNTTQFGAGSPISSYSDTTIQGNGDVSASAGQNIKTPFGDVSIKVDIVKEGCTITVSKTFTSPVKSFTTTETYTAPGCKETPSPSPSPSLPPEPSPGTYPANTFVHIFVLETLTNVSYEVFYTDTNKYKFIVSKPSRVNGADVFLLEGRANHGNYYLGGFPDYTLEKRPLDFYYYLYSSTGSRLGQFPFTGGSDAFYAADGINICTRTNEPYENWYPYYHVGTGVYANGLKVWNGNSDDIFKNFTIFGSFVSVQILECNPFKPKWNPPPMPEDKCCKETASMLRKIMKVLAVDEIEKNGIKIPKEFLAPGGTGQLKVSNYSVSQSREVHLVK